MTENKRFVDYFDKDHNYIIQDLWNEDEYQVGFANCDEDLFLELVNELNDENDILKQKLKTKYIVNKQYEELQRLKEENKQLKTQIKIFEKFLDENNLDIDWELFCTVDECKKDSDDYGCKECKYLGVM